MRLTQEQQQQQLMMMMMMMMMTKSEPRRPAQRLPLGARWKQDVAAVAVAVAVAAVADAVAVAAVADVAIAVVIGFVSSVSAHHAMRMREQPIQPRWHRASAPRNSAAAEWRWTS